jgi:hypothetical protein
MIEKTNYILMNANSSPPFRSLGILLKVKTRTLKEIFVINDKQFPTLM